ncbi:MAG: flagellar protein FlaG [Pseudomonadota bacterium]
MKPEFSTTIALPVKASVPDKSGAVEGNTRVPEVKILGAAAKPVQQEVATSRPEPKEQLEQLEQLVEKLNLDSTSISRQLKFQFDDDANRSVIQVFDRETEQLIRQIPSEEALERLKQAGGDVFQLIDTTA